MPAKNRNRDSDERCNTYDEEAGRLLLSTHQNKQAEENISMLAKTLALGGLITHNVAIVYMMRYSQTVAPPGQERRYLPSAVVFATEVAKWVCAFLLVCVEEGGPLNAVGAVANWVRAQPVDMLKLAVPGLLYAVQNNLLFLALSNLTAGVFTVTYQLKTLFTAILSVVFLKQVLVVRQWVSLLCLTLGVVMIQATETSPRGISVRDNPVVGLLAVLGACLTSGCAGVYMEKLLKESGGASLWMRNVQLAMVGTPMTLCAALWFDGVVIREAGLLQGFNWLVWGIVALNAFGGLAIAAVLRYADNIVKCFASAAAIVFTCTISHVMGEFQTNPRHACGAVIVVASTVMYTGVVPIETLLLGGVRGTYGSTAEACSRKV